MVPLSGADAGIVFCGFLPDAPASASSCSSLLSSVPDPNESSVSSCGGSVELSSLERGFDNPWAI